MQLIISQYAQLEAEARVRSLQTQIYMAGRGGQGLPGQGGAGGGNALPGNIGIGPNSGLPGGLLLDQATGTGGVFLNPSTGNYQAIQPALPPGIERSWQEAQDWIAGGARVPVPTAQPQPWIMPGGTTTQAPQNTINFTGDVTINNEDDIHRIAAEHAQAAGEAVYQSETNRLYTLFRGNKRAVPTPAGAP